MQKEAVELGFRCRSNVSEAACASHHTALPLELTGTQGWEEGGAKQECRDSGSQINSEHSPLLSVRRN